VENIKELTYEVNGRTFVADMELVDKILLTDEDSLKVIEYTTLNSKIIPVKRKFQYKNDTVYYIENYQGVGQSVVVVDENALIQNLVQSIQENTNFEETDFFQNVQGQARAKRSSILLSKNYAIQGANNELHIHKGLFALISSSDGHIEGSSERIVTNFSAKEVATCTMLNASGTIWTNNNQVYQLFYMETDMKKIHPMFTVKKKGVEGADWQFQVLPSKKVNLKVDLTKIKQELDNSNWDATKLLQQSNQKDSEERIMDIFL